MDRKVFFTLLIFGLFLGLLYTVYLIFEPFVMSLIWAGILVALTYPLYKRLLARMPGKPELASALMCLGLTLLLVLPVTLLALILFQDLSEGAQKLTVYIQKQDYRSWLTLDHPLLKHPLLQRPLDLLNRFVDWEKIDLQGAVANGVQNVSRFMVEHSKGFFAAFSSFLFLLGMILINMFFLFRDGHQFVRFLKRRVPIPEAQQEMVLGRMHEVVRASIYGTLGTAVVQGVLGGTAFLMLGLPSAVLWGVIMMLMSFLPLAGPFVVWAPFAVWLLFQGAWIKAVMLTVWGVVVIGSSDNILRPILIRSVSSKENQLNTLVLFLSVLGGLRIFGFAGIILAPLMIVMLLTLLELLALALRPPAEPLHAIAGSPVSDTVTAPAAAVPVRDAAEVSAAGPCSLATEAPATSEPGAQDQSAALSDAESSDEDPAKLGDA
ncbi:MAG: AI-2E family transporter [Candidatus Sericytochromatia bacterium]|nr:AI-2E family transporter [Candidatus Sericytochromatia bacterium]